MRRFTGPLPFCIEPRRHKAGAHRVELCRAALETACSPRSTLLSRVSGGNRTRRLDLHRATCQPLHHRHHHSPSSPGWIRTSDLPHVTGMSCRWTTGPVPRPGFEPGTPRSKRGMIVRFTIGALSGRQGSRTLISGVENRLSRAARPTGIRLPSVSGPTGNRTRISSLPNWCRPVGP